MKYLFFDIECANSYVEDSKICSFGYVLTDEKYEVIDQEDILIRPVGKFKLTGRKNRADCYLKYDESVFKRQEKFPHHYEKIKGLLEDKDTLVLGFSTDSDVRYILTELLYYSLKPINFEYYDVQELFCNAYGFKEQVSLDNVSYLLNQGGQGKEHDSLSDAISTMNICKKLSQDENKTIGELLKKYDCRKESFYNYRLSADRDIPIEEIVSFDKAYRYVEATNKASDKFAGKMFCFSSILEKENPGRMINILKIIVNNGGSYCPKLSLCNIYIRCDDECADDTRMAYLRENSEVQKNIEIIKYSDFLKKINESNESLDSVSPIEGLMKKHKKNKWIENRILIMEECNKEESTTTIGNLFGDLLEKYKSKSDK